MHILQRVRSSTFLRHNLIFFGGSVAVGVLNYLYYPVMGRLLAPASFGEVQALISLFLQITVFLLVLGLVTITIVANYKDTTSRNAVVLEFEKLAFCISLLLLAAAIIFQDNLKHFLQFESSTPFILLAVALVASVPFTFRGAFLRGKQRFALASTVNILGAGGKLVFAVLFVALGYGTAGAIGGLVCAQVMASIFATWQAYRFGLHRHTDQPFWRLPSLRILRPEFGYGLLVLVGSLIVTLQYSVDVLVVKHFFDPHVAGLYAGVASVARIVVFLTASIALVLMPMVKIEHAAAKNRHLLIKSLVLCITLGLPVVILFSLAPAWVMQLLMDDGFEGVAGLLPRLSLALFVVSILNVFVSYYLALRQFWLAPAVLIGGLATYGLMIFNHGSLSAIVNDVLIGSLAMLAVLGLWASLKSKGVYMT
jgi:O-antigen/teichoic acid export membrane protein